MKTHRIAAIGGDGIGPEVIEAGIEVLQALAKAEGGFGFEFERFPWSSQLYLDEGHYIPAGGLERLRKFDAIFFGAVGSQKVPDHVSLWGLRLPICQGFDQYANVRPARVLPGVKSPLANGKDIDWVVIRENTEGEYSGVGGRVHKGLPIETASDVAIFTRTGVERIHRFAFELARKRPRKHLTLVTKSNAQRHAMVMWDEIFFEVAKGYPDVRWDRELVDAMTTRMVLKPATIDVMVATNLHADILSDLAAALSGSLGIAPTANLNPERANSLDVRAHPRLGLRHHRQGHREPDRHVLDRGDDARAPGRGEGRRAPHAGGREGHRQRPAYARPGRQGHHRAGHAGGDRGALNTVPWKSHNNCK